MGLQLADRMMRAQPRVTEHTNILGAPRTALEVARVQTRARRRKIAAGHTSRFLFLLRTPWLQKTRRDRDGLCVCSVRLCVLVLFEGFVPWQLASVAWFPSNNIKYK